MFFFIIFQILKSGDEFWSDGPSFPYAFCCGNAIVTDNTIYVSGGRKLEKQKIVNSADIHFLKFGDTKWNFLKQMKVPRTFHSSFVFSHLVSFRFNNTKVSSRVKQLNEKLILYKYSSQLKTKTTFIGRNDFILLGGTRKKRSSQGSPSLVEHVSLDKARFYT